MMKLKMFVGTKNEIIRAEELAFFGSLVASEGCCCLCSSQSTGGLFCV